jgi:hypothetical protein
VSQTPEDLRRAKVDRGASDFNKRVFDEYSDLGRITDLRYGRFSNDPQPELVVVGTAGAVFVGSDQRVKKTIHFIPRMYNRVVLIELKAGEAPAFLGRGGSWIEKVHVFDENGALRWEYGSFSGIDDSAAGDVNGDGVAEFAVGLNGGGGVRLLNAEGRELWRKREGNVWHVEIAYPKQGAPGVIIHSDARGTLTMRNGGGEVLARYRPARFVSDFALARWGNDARPRHLILAGEGVVLVLDLDGRQTAQLEAPGLHPKYFGFAASTPVCFSAVHCYFATLVDYASWDRSVLYLNDPAGKIAYREVFEQRCGAVGTIPAAPGTKDESLLVGCSGEVWKYASLH